MNPHPGTKSPFRGPVTFRYPPKTVSLCLCPSHSLSTLVIILSRFGGSGNLGYYNDTWSFDISTRKWTELQCTGSIPSPRSGHAAVLVDDVMYIFGGFTGKTYLDDLIAL
jgi:Galactose oxidase, central domain